MTTDRITKQYFVSIDAAQAAGVEASGKYIPVRRLNPNGQRCGIIAESKVDGINHAVWKNPSAELELSRTASQLNMSKVKTFNHMTAEIE